MNESNRRYILPPSDYLARFLPTEDDSSDTNYTEPSQEELTKKFTVQFHNGPSVEAAPLQTIYQLALQNGIPHKAECGAKAKCTTCSVAILEGVENCLPRNRLEREIAQHHGFDSQVRLACQARVTGPVVCRPLVIDDDDLEASEEETHAAGRESELAVMFADVRGFTELSSQHLPYDIIHALNRYFRTGCEEVDRYDGYADKYMGDGLMALFGLAKTRDTHPCVDAVEAAIAMQRRLPGLNQYLQRHLHLDFQIGIGIHYGSVVVGELGFPAKKQFTAIGDVVNVAARIEGQCKELNADILISDEVLEHLPKEHFGIHATREVTLAGKEEPVSVHSVVT